MKKLIAVTALAGLVAVGCAHRGGSSDRETKSYGEGSSMQENTTTTPSSQSGTSSNPSGSSTSPSGSSSSSSNPSSSGSSSNSVSQPSNSSTPQ